eukprot:COSAG02_NODE_30862_length_543_cov_23.288288_1_plen_84_part_01
MIQPTVLCHSAVKKQGLPNCQLRLLGQTHGAGQPAPCIHRVSSTAPRGGRGHAACGFGAPGDREQRAILGLEDGGGGGHIGTAE